MTGTHLTPSELASYAGGEMSASSPAQAGYVQHISECALCATRAGRFHKLESGLRGLPRQTAPRDLADRIIGAVDWRVTQDEERRHRLPYIAFATAAACIISLWFAFQTLAELLDTDALDFLSLYSSRPDLLVTYYSDAWSALWESLPVPAMALTLFAISVAIVLAQQLMASFRPGLSHKLRRV